MDQMTFSLAGEIPLVIPAPSRYYFGGFKGVLILIPLPNNDLMSFKQTREMLFLGLINPIPTLNPSIHTRIRPIKGDVCMDLTYRISLSSFVRLRSFLVGNYKY